MGGPEWRRRAETQVVERRVEVAVSALAVGVGRPEARYLYLEWLHSLSNSRTAGFEPHLQLADHPDAKDCRDEGAHPRADFDEEHPDRE